mgnify:CR=1 FL=1
MTNNNDNLLVLEDNVPLPKDNRFGTGESLPSNFKQIISTMRVDQSFFVSTEGEAHRKAKTNAIRSAIRRIQQDEGSDVSEDTKFSVRKYDDPHARRSGLRVYRVA